MAHELAEVRCLREKRLVGHAQSLAQPLGHFLANRPQPSFHFRDVGHMHTNGGGKSSLGHAS